MTSLALAMYFLIALFQSVLKALLLKKRELFNEVVKKLFSKRKWKF